MATIDLTRPDRHSRRLFAAVVSGDSPAVRSARRGILMASSIRRVGKLRNLIRPQWLGGNMRERLGAAVHACPVVAGLRVAAPATRAQTCGPIVAVAAAPAP